MSQRDPDLLPNFDEFGPNEELDYNEDAQGHEEVSVDPVAGPSTSPFAVEEPCSSNPRNSSSQQQEGNDHLPRMNYSERSNIGPALPPGMFLMGDDAAPDDPSCDPEDPGMSHSSAQIGPILPNFLNNSDNAFNPPVPDCSHMGPSRNDITNTSQAPSLPDDELRGSCNSASSSFSLPPPEPTTSRVIGPIMPAQDVCPAIPSREIGPSVPSPGIGPQIPSREIGPSRPLREMGPALPAREIEPVMPVNEFAAPSVPSRNIGPAMPPSARQIGPAMPPDLLPMENVNDDNEEEEEQGIDLYGPAPPPPDSSRGVSLPPEMPCDDDDEIIGPLPSSQDDERAAEEYAIRRLLLEKQKEESSANKREEWMTQLPQKLTNYGLGARTFSKSTTNGEKDNSWTETPEEKRRRLERGECSSSSQSNGQRSGILAAAQHARDQEQERIAQQCNSTRSESLLDSHQRKRKVDAGQETSSGERKGFDREKDMEVRGFKSGSAAELKERCGQLSSRFGSSVNQKFL